MYNMTNKTSAKSENANWGKSLNSAMGALNALNGLKSDSGWDRLTTAGQLILGGMK